MTMRIAAFNVENLFERARIMNLDDWEEGRPVLERVTELSDLLEKPTYSAADKTRILILMRELGLKDSDTAPYVILRRNRGALIMRRRTGPEIIADGRGDWIGWVELRKGPVNEVAMMNTGRVIRDVNADILGVVEAEDRTSLQRFSDEVITMVGGAPYPRIMLIDGNDQRGIDVGLMVKDGYSIGDMRSHVHEGGEAPVFSRDCPEFAVTTPDGEVIWVLVNHLKSKGFGSAADNNRRRKAQATAVAGYYARLRSDGFDNVVVLGDLNDTPDSDPLSPLLSTDLRDVSDHPSFDTGTFKGRGTYGLGNDNNKIDYILLSPALFARITAAGIFRMGAWPGSRPKRWEVYEELEREVHAASDHHAIWVDLA
jgi:endonuclease/exonuclease/phosphatase family metal-dependent hydrolase